MNVGSQQYKLTEHEALELFSGRRFNSYSSYFRRVLGGRTQKVAINAGFSCPNRDGKVGVEGCTFCNNLAFTPSYCEPNLSVTTQINEGVSFHLNRYRTATKYLAYFQSFSNTYAPLERLRELYDEALAHPLIAGVIIGTRPDCVDEEKLDYFAKLSRSKYVAIEYGVESTFDQTLQQINRGHDFAEAKWAIEQSAKRGIHTGAHFILGLPGESEEMLMEQVDTINALPLTTIKFHQLQIFRDTQMATEYDTTPSKFRFWSKEEYIALFIQMLERLRPDLVVERFASEAPPRYHHGPNWGLVRNESLLNLFEKELARQNTYQGRLYHG
ncbi:MAG: TIGR01212 family radical SAM protein [Rikenellaceae bacterium]